MGSESTWFPPTPTPLIPGKEPRLFSTDDDDTLTLKDVDKFGLVAFIAAAEKEGPVEDEGGGPGRAGKSSLDIVNSLVSIAGCFTIPTKYNRQKNYISSPTIPKIE